MHKKFREKMTLDELLNEVEGATNRIENLHRSSVLLNDYCKHHKNVAEIGNMLHLTGTFELSLLYISKELRGIINREKYHQPEAIESIGEGFDMNNIIFDD